MGDRLGGVQAQEVLASPGQHALWFANALVRGRTRAYTEVVMDWPHALDAATVRRALHRCQQAHAMLRATLHRLPWGAIALRPDTAPAIALEPLPQWQSWRDQPDFALERAPGMRAWWGGARWVVAVHRMVADGGAVDQIVRELMAYAAQPGHEEDVGTGTGVGGVDAMDVLVSQRKAWEAGALEAHLQYWLDKLPTAVAPLELPWEHAPTAGAVVPSATAQIWISGPVLAQWQAHCDEAGWGLPQLLRAGVMQWLARWTGQSHVRLAAVVDGRDARMQGMVGPWEDVRVSCMDVQPPLTLAQLVNALGEQDGQDAAHAAIPFEWVLQHLNSDGMQAQVLPYQVAFEWRDAPDRYVAASPGVRVHMLREQTLRAELVLSAQPAQDGGICVALRYPPMLLSEARALDALHRWRTLLEQGLAHPHGPVHALSWVSPQELECLSAPWPAPECTPEPVHLRMKALLALHGDRPAVQCASEVLTHAQLHARAQGLADRLVQQGVGSEMVVAVAMERSAALLVVLLAVWKAGAAFLPLDPQYPAPRIRHMLTDAGAHCLLTDALLMEPMAHVCAGLPVADRLWAWDAPAWPMPEGATLAAFPANGVCSPQHLAYVIYTSGSTGLPKGVAVEHGPLSLHCQATAHLYDMRCESRELHFLSISFDGALERWVVPLLVGGCVVLRPPALWTAAQTLQAMQDMQVNNAGFPTSYLQTLAQWAQDHPADHRLRLLSFGGEGMPRATFEQVQRALAPDWLINGYGPTEAVISPLAWKVPAGTRFDSPYAPVGRAVGPRRAYVLDAFLQPVPPGVAGELYIGGACLARGYLGQPDATAERFVPDPFAGLEGARMYRTGDRVRWRTDGVVEYLGRVDQQVKVRGYRVELGEVESALRSLPGVADGAVALKGQRLVGYVVMAPGADVPPATLRTQLQQSLPDFMVPSVVVALSTLPLTPGGKTDRNALPEPAQVPRKVEPARTPLEQRLVRLWQEVLKIPVVGVTDHFFDLGGDSLSALGLLGLLEEVLPGHRLGIVDLFHHPDIRQLARAIEARGQQEDAAEPAWQDVVQLQSPAVPSGAPVLYCFPGLLVSTREYLALVRALGPGQVATGFVCHSLSAADAAAQCDSQSLQAANGGAVESLARRYADYIRMHSQGRAVVLLGWSWGGVLALETARLLGDQVPVQFVGMLDVCALDAEFAKGGERPLDPAVRARVQADIDAWLPQSRMQAQWRQLLQRMDATVYTQFLHYVNNSPDTLPLDGPAVGSREHIFWTLMDNALVFRHYTMRPLDCPIHAWIAQDSLLRAMNVIDWNDYSSRVERVQVIEGATHLSIVNDPRFHQSFVQSLQQTTQAMASA